MIGGAFLELYTDLDSGIIIEDLNPNSPLWVGAWWLGFVMSCLMSWSCALIIGCYPATISRQPKTPNQQNEDVGFNAGKTTPGYGKIKDLPKVIWALLTNPTYMMINF